MLDCKGLACPQPVIQTKELIEQQAPDTVEVLVDNEAASQNVSRFMGTQGYEATVERQGDAWLITGRRDANKPAAEAPPEVAASAPEDARTLVFIRSDKLGHGDDVLGAGLMKNYILTLKEMGPSLWRILFLNAGVKLCCQGSQSLEPLKELVDNGVSILVCGTCLEFFDLMEAKQVGETTNMLDVVTSLQVAGKVITV